MKDTMIKVEGEVLSGKAVAMGLKMAINVVKSLRHRNTQNYSLCSMLMHIEDTLLIVIDEIKAL